jgi:hypothetical protein
MRRGLRFALAFSFFGRLAFAQSAQDEAAAATQFERGLAEMKAGRYDSGCPALQESYRLDARPGTLFTLAECEAKWGLVASAVAHYDDYLSRFQKMPPDQRRGQRGREKIAEAQARALRGDVPTLELDVPQGAPNSLKVTRDGVSLGRASLGVALPLDPGEHVIVVTLESGATHEQKVTVSRGDHKALTLEIPTAAPVTTQPVQTTQPQPTIAQTIEPPPKDEPKASSHVGWSLMTLGIGIAGLGAGAITGALTVGKKADIDKHCAGTICDAQGKAAADDSKTLGAISTVAFIVGAVATSASIVLFLTEPKKNKPQAAILLGPTGGGVSWSW